MKHLILGYGTMGKRYEQILKDLGDSVDTADIGFDPATVAIKYDSVLICTFPETHVDWIYEVSDYMFTGALFCEKPVLTKLEDKVITSTNNIKTMVSCPWRYCRCINPLYPPLRFRCNYVSRDKKPELDLIHFIDLDWENYGMPLNSSVKVFGPLLKYHSTNFDVVIHSNSNKNFTIFNEEEVIHNPVCNMFISMMEDWRKVIKGELISPNPVEKAEFRTKWLLEALKNDFKTAPLL